MEAAKVAASLAETADTLRGDPSSLYNLACMFALCDRRRVGPSDSRARARRLLATSLVRDEDPQEGRWALVAADVDLENVRDRIEELRIRIEAARRAQPALADMSGSAYRSRLNEILSGAGWNDAIHEAADSPTGPTRRCQCSPPRTIRLRGSYW